MIQPKEAVLLAFAASGGDPYSPVQLQKFLFIVDREIGGRIGGPVFNFRPYDYGPFDSAVYDAANQLSREGLVVVDFDPGTPVRKYLATSAGRIEGERLLESIANRAGQEYKTYLRDLSSWVRSQSFESLVSSVYKIYPDMKVNSVFRG